MVGATVIDDRPAAETPRSAPSESHGLAYHPALDGLRAIAVLAVIVYHDNYSWLPGGFLGVDVFFVLSGFLITTLLVLEYRRRSTIHLGGFWSRRARRLLPALLLVLCFVAAYTRLIEPWERTAIRNDGWASLFYVANWRFIFDGQSYFQLFSAASPLRHMWSLAIEEQYYLVWPLVVFLCLRARRGSLRLLAAVAGAGAALSVVAMHWRFTPANPNDAYYATDARAHSLLIGALLAMLFVSWRPTARAARAIVPASIVAIVGVFAAFHVVTGSTSAYYGLGSLVFALLTAVVIAGAMQPGMLASALSVGPLVWIGRISYGLYLWHWPITVWLVPSRVSLDGNGLNALRLAATFAAATLSFYLVEQPIRRRGFRPAVAVLVFAPIAAIAAAVLWVSAAGARPAPSYLVGTAPTPAQTAAATSAGAPQFPWALGDPLICGEPRPEETDEATRAAAAQPALQLPGASGQRVLLLGDSTACSLWPGLHAVGDVEHVTTDQGSVFGCGIAVEEFTSTRNEPVTPNTQRCKPFLDWAIPTSLSRVKPTAVVWMSTWEKEDIVDSGRTIVADTPEWRTAMNARIDARVQQLTAGGARVFMVTEAAPAPNPAQGTETFDRSADDASYARLNDLLRAFATQHPDKVTLVDLAARVCPNGPTCPEDVEGLHARPDGRHFTPTAAVWAARYVFTQMFGSTR